MGVNGFEDSGTMDHKLVDVNIECVLKIRYPPPEVPVVRVSRDKNTVFTLEIYGYPEPTKFGLKIESGNSVSDVDKKTYDISYISTVPPFGLVTVTFYDKTTRVITTYILSVTNTEGELKLKFDVINQGVKSKTSKIENKTMMTIIGFLIAIFV
ncbi:uncharacterized protein LOC131950782 [Physella acuta]|uniref:uncharacterized protein LOC131950782 n=1 Tax=Physella acuta TaxID=109671 RepID=UPI0027DCC8BB|nr:uncharacterized protein LOC131950782 [Physella acuta]